MPNSSESLPQAEPEPRRAKLPPLVPGELATRLRLIPPIVPEPDGRKPKPFFAACAATPCNGPTEKAVFMAYAALAGPTGATWAIKRNRVWFFARQEKVVEDTGWCMKTVQRMTFRLLKSGRLRCVQSGRGRLPHAMMVVPEGWDSQSRGDSQSPLRSVEATHSRHNRAFTKRRAPYATRLVEEETPSQGVNPAEGSVTQPSPAMKAAPSAPYQVERKNHDPTRKLVLLATPDQSQPHIEAMREIAQRAASRTQEPSDGQKGVPDPDPTPERVAAALAIFDQVDANTNKQTGTHPTKQSVDPGGGYTGGTPDICPNCQHDRIYYGSCSNCGADLRDYGGDFNYGH